MLISLSRNLFTEDPFAVVRPKVYANLLRSSRLFYIGRLKEAELGTVLPCPLTGLGLRVDCRIAQHLGIVLRIVGETIFFGKGSQGFHQGLFATCCIGFHKNLAHLDALTIQDLYVEDVSKEEEEFTSVDRDLDFEQISDIFAASWCFELVLGNLYCFLDSTTALRA